MKRTLLRAAVLTATAALVAAGSAALTSPAGAAVSPNIIGGSPAPSTPWEVQLVFEQGGGTYGCTGEQINASWVLTANHCADGTTAMDVYHSNSTTDLGPAAPVDELDSAPTGDIALAHLATPSPLDSYAPLDLDYSVQGSGTGTIMGYGLRADQQESDGLYEASVSLAGSNSDAYGGTAQHVTGIDGASNHGDSGGPLIVDGSVVAVCSTGDQADPGSNINAGSNYAVLSQSGSWISQTAGV